MNYAIFAILTAGINFLTIIYMTRNMTPEEFGMIGIFIAIIYLLPQLISFSAIGLVSINKSKMNETNFLNFSQTYISFSIFIFILVFIVFLIFISLFGEYIYIFVPIIAFIQYLALFHNAELIQDSRSTRFSIYRLSLSIISFVFTFILIEYLNMTWDGRLFSILISELIILLIMLKYSFITLHKFNFNYNGIHFKEYIYFGFPLLFGLVAGWLLNQGDRFIVLHFFTLKEVGIYTLAYSIGTIVNVVNQAMINAITPTLYRYLNKKEGYKIVRNINIYYSIIILSISLSIGLSSYWYIPLIFGEQYINSSDIILFISLAFAFNGMYRITGGVIAFYKENKLQMKLLYISAIINIIISILLIPIFNILSPAIGTLIAYIFLVYFSYKYSWHILKKEEQC